MRPAKKGMRGSLFLPKTHSLPLDRPRRRAHNIVPHAVDAADLVDDPCRDAAQELVGEGAVVDGHAASRGHRAQGAGVIGGAAVAPHAGRPLSMHGFTQRRPGKRVKSASVE